jgi:hypothetical protein
MRWQAFLNTQTIRQNRERLNEKKTQRLKSEKQTEAPERFRKPGSTANQFR